MCKQNLYPPVYSCLTGHPICNHCYHKFKFCRLCRSQFHGKNVRLRFLENLHPRTKYPCDWKALGCGIGPLGLDVNAHSGHCMYQHLVNCPIKSHRSCTFIGSTPNFVRHMRSVHPGLINEAPHTSVLIKNFVPFCFHRDWADIRILYAYGTCFQFVWFVQSELERVVCKMYTLNLQNLPVLFNFVVKFVPFEDLNDRKHTVSIRNNSQPIIRGPFSSGQYQNDIVDVYSLLPLCSKDKGDLLFIIKIIPKYGINTARYPY